MGSQDRFLRKQFQGSGDNPSRTALMFRRGIEKAIEDNVHTAIAVIVKNYSAKLQRVTLVEKCVPSNTAATYYNVPIVGTGMALSRVHHFETIDGGSSKPTSGILLFTKENTTDAWKMFSECPAPNANPFDFTGVFIPGPLIEGDDMPVPGYAPGDDTFGAPTLPNEFEDGDEALIDRRTGSHIVFKSNGDIVIKAAGDVYIGGTDQDTATGDFQDAARKGDAGDGMGGSISGGSNRVHIGD